MKFILFFSIILTSIKNTVNNDLDTIPLEIIKLKISTKDREFKFEKIDELIKIKLDRKKKIQDFLSENPFKSSIHLRDDIQKEKIPETVELNNEEKEEFKNFILKENDFKNLHNRDNFYLENAKLDYDPSYFFMDNICSNYITNSILFRNDKYLIEDFCTIFHHYLKREDFINEYFYVAVDYFGTQFLDSLIKYEEDLKKLFISTTKISKFYDDDQENVLQNINSGFLIYYEKLQDIIFQIFKEYKKKVESDIKIFDTLITKIKKKIPNADEQNMYLILLNTYKTSKLSKQDYFYNFLNKYSLYSDLLTSSIFNRKTMLIIDDFAYIRKISECSVKKVFVINEFLIPCVDIFRKKGILDNIVGMCKIIFGTIFQQMKSNRLICLFNHFNLDFWKGLMINIISEHCSDVAKTNGKRMEETVYKVVGNAKFKFLEIRKKIKNITGLKYIDRKNYLFFYYFFTFIDHPDFEATYMPYYEKYIKLTDNYFFIAYPIMDYMYKTKVQMAKEFKMMKKVREKSKQDFIFNLRYRCINASPLDYLHICNNVFNFIKLGFYMKFKDASFLTTYLIAELVSGFDMFDVNLNNHDEIIIYYTNSFNQILNNISMAAIDSLVLIDEIIQEELGRDKIILILLFGKYLNMNLDLSYETIVKIINAYLLQNYEKFKNINIRQEEFHGLILEMGYFIYSKDSLAEDTEVPKEMYRSYIRQIVHLQKKETEEFYKNKDYLYKHYNNWDNSVKTAFRLSKSKTLSSLLRTCNKQKNEDDKCLRESMNINILYTSCPGFSERFDSENCVTKCPDNFGDDGLFCFKPEVIFKEVFADREECGENCVVYDKDYWVAPCPVTYSSYLLMCFPECPDGTEDYGNSCRKIFVSKIKVFF